MIFWGTKWFLNIDKLKGKSLLEINRTSSLRDTPENGKKRVLSENERKARERETKKSNYTIQKVVNFSNCQSACWYWKAI